MTSNLPRVSVVMSVYNGMPLLRAAVASILDQTFQDFEFVIVNDGSTDGSLDYLQSVAAADPRVRIIDQANAGLTRALIAGVAQSRASVIARMDADDWSEPGRLAAQLELLSRQSELGAVSCGIEYVREDLSHITKTERQFDPAVWPLLTTMFNVIGGHGHMMFRRDAYEEVGGYDPHFRFSQDYDLWGRLLRRRPMGEVPGLFYRFRVGHDSISTRHGDLQRALAVEIASREYSVLTGARPNEEVVGDTLNFWAMRLDPQTPTAQLEAIDRHCALAFAAYSRRFPERRAAVRDARHRISRMWLGLARKRRGNGWRDRLSIARVAARWCPAEVRAAARSWLLARASDRRGTSHRGVAQQ